MNDVKHLFLAYLIGVALEWGVYYLACAGSYYFNH